MNDESVEMEIQAKGLAAPRITPADSEANIAAEYFFTASEGVFGADNNPHLFRKKSGHVLGDTPLSLLTFCVLVLKNGFCITGESACASPANYDDELGRKIARQNAVAKIWPLMGYELRSKLTSECEVCK